jgi:hypothetical protein
MEERHKYSGSIRNQRLLSLSNTEAGHSISKVLEEQTTCKCGIPILDGSKSSNIKVTTLLTSRTIRFLKFKERKMLKDRKLESMEETINLIRDGMLFTLTPREEIE